MKNLNCSLLILFMMMPPFVTAADLKITIADITEQQGVLLVAVLSSEEEFKEAVPASTSLILRPSGGSTSFTLHGLTSGSYGVRVMHDVNGNSKMDTNLVGIPKEPWGFSNNAKGKFGPPKWPAVKMEINANTETVINLN